MDTSPHAQPSIPVTSAHGRCILQGVAWFAVASLLVRPGCRRRHADRGARPAGGGRRRPAHARPVGARRRLVPPRRPAACGRSVVGFRWDRRGARADPRCRLVDGPGRCWTFLLNVPPAPACVPIALRHDPESVSGTVMMLRVGPGSSYRDPPVVRGRLERRSGERCQQRGGAGVRSGGRGDPAAAGGHGPGRVPPRPAFDASFGRAMPLCTALLGGAALLAFMALDPAAEVPHRARRLTHGWLMVPPPVP